MIPKWKSYITQFETVALQVTRNGTVLLVETEQAEALMNMKRSYHFIVQIIAEDTHTTVDLYDVPIIPSHVDLFSDGSILLVQYTSVQNRNIVERNAWRYSQKDELLDAFVLGHGVNHMQIDETDVVWVGYSDEGVFDELGYGKEGLVAYNQKGEKIFGVDYSGMAEIYALNVAHSKEIYFYYYMDHHVIGLSNNQEILNIAPQQKEPTYTFDSFILCNNQIFASVDLYTCMRFEIEQNQLIPKEEFELVDQQSKKLEGLVRMRGKHLFVFTEDAIYKREFV